MLFVERKKWFGNFVNPRPNESFCTTVSHISASYCFIYASLCTIGAIPQHFMTDSLGTLLSRSYTSYKTLIRPIIVGAVLFAVISTAGQALFMHTTMDALPNGMGDIQKMEELADRFEAGDEAALNEMLETMGLVNEQGELISDDQMEDMVTGMMMSMLPSISSLFIVMMIVSIIASAYYFVIAVFGVQDTAQALRQSPSIVFPLLGVWIWSFLRSFAWIPFIGVIFAIVIGPRLVAAPVVLLKEKKGITDSVRLSYERTRGYWGKIVGNLLVMALLMWILMMVIGLITSLLFDDMYMISAFIAGLLQWLSTGFATIFVVALSETVMAHQFKPTT